MNNELIKSQSMIIRNFIDEKSAKGMGEIMYQDSLKGIKSDTQVPAAHSVCNPNFGLIALCNKCFEVGNMIGENVFPTYCYSRLYKKGNVLERHTDRIACEISLTVHLDGDKEWPIWVQTPDGEKVSVELQSGDALIYLGCLIPHWREAYKGNMYSQLFLHYVRSNGMGAAHYFDHNNRQLNVNYSKLEEEYQSLLT